MLVSYNSHATGGTHSSTFKGRDTKGQKHHRQMSNSHPVKNNFLQQLGSSNARGECWCTRCMQAGTIENKHIVRTTPAPVQRPP